MSVPETFPAWITKHALTHGVYEITATLVPRIPGMILQCNSYGQTFYGEDYEWHRTKDAAMAYAQKRRAFRVAALRKELDHILAVELE